MYLAFHVPHSGRLWPEIDRGTGMSTACTEASQEIRLDNAKNNFERKRKDTFSIKARDVGVPDRIRIGHDNSGMAPGWHLDHVVVRNQVGRRVGRCWRLFCWVARDQVRSTTA